MAKGVSRAFLDTAEGVIFSNQSSVKANGLPIAIHGVSVLAHGGTPHDSATMIAASNNVKIGGVAVVRAENLATCGHAATGSSSVLVGE